MPIRMAPCTAGLKRWRNPPSATRQQQAQRLASSCVWRLRLRSRAEYGRRSEWQSSGQSSFHRHLCVSRWPMGRLGRARVAAHGYKIKSSMRAVVQRVSRAQVSINGEITGKIGRGLVVLLGVATTDNEADAEYLANKIAGLRIFEDKDGKMNLSVIEVGGAVLAVSQFTLYGDTRGGRRPSFIAAARPEQARKLYEHFIARIRAIGLVCETGRFQEMMQVELVNNGPVTILLDSTKLF